MHFYNVLPNPPPHLCIHRFVPYINLVTHRSWQQCKFCGRKA